MGAHRSIAPGPSFLTLHLLCTLGLALGQQALGSYRSTPTFVWSSESYLSFDQDGETSRVSYETAPAASLARFLIGSLLSPSGVHAAAEHLLNATEIQQRPPEALVICVGSQVHDATLTQPSLADGLQPLRSGLETAGSSLYLPNIIHKGPGTVTETLAQHLRDNASLRQLGSCSGMDQPIGVESMAANIQSLLTEQADEPQVVIVCMQQGSLQEEMEALSQVRKAVAESAKRHVMVYTSDMALQEQGGLPARHLLSQAAGGKAAASSYTCDAKCETQVKLLEAVILAITLIIAVWTGSMMLHGLGTPTRFEAPKDTMQREG